MRKGAGSAYDNWNISVAIYDTDIRNSYPSQGGDRKTFEVMTLQLKR